MTYRVSCTFTAARRALSTHHVTPSRGQDWVSISSALSTLRSAGKLAVLRRSEP